MGPALPPPGACVRPTPPNQARPLAHAPPSPPQVHACSGRRRGVAPTPSRTPVRERAHRAHVPHTEGAASNRRILPLPWSQDVMSTPLESSLHGASVGVLGCTNGQELRAVEQLARHGRWWLVRAHPVSHACNARGLAGAIP
jgi:hypothetical protein